MGNVAGEKGLGFFCEAGRQESLGKRMTTKILLALRISFITFKLLF